MIACNIATVNLQIIDHLQKYNAPRRNAMRTTKVVVLFSVLFACMLMASDSFASGAWSERPGTINNAMTLADGATINLDAVCVEKIRGDQNPAYFVARECFDPDSRIVVLITPPASLRYGQTVDITGTLTTLSNGYRAIENPSIYGYLDSNGNLLYHGPLVKGIEEPTPWPWKELLNPSSNQRKSTYSNVLSINRISSLSTAASTDPPGTIPTPSSDPAPITCSSIAAAKTAYDTYYDATNRPRVMITLQCYGVSNPATGSFTLLEDGTGDTIPVYATTSVQTTDRINKITATILKNTSGNYWLEVDAGPSWQSQDVMGSLQKCASGTIAWAKTFPDNTTLPTDGRTYALENKRVTWIDIINNQFYVEDQDGNSGILVNGETANDLPCSADISGQIVTSSQGERNISDGSFVITPGGLLPNPRGMANRSLGGSSFNTYTLGSPAGNGLNNIGMLVRTWGKVTEVDSTDGFFYLDDGSHLADGTTDISTSQSNIGIRVLFTDTVYPSVGDYAIITGICSKTTDGSTNVLCIKTRGLSQVITYPPLITPTNFGAIGCNAKVVLSWDKINVESYRIYKSTSETGTYTALTDCTSTEYTDTAVTNESTYWYKIASISGGVAGPLSSAVSAAPSASIPAVSIDNIIVDSNGLATIQCTGPSNTGYTLLVDDQYVWTFDQSAIGNITYDTTQLSNGSHKFTIAALQSGNIGLATQTINVQNLIYDFQVPDDMNGYQPVSASFSTNANWTLTCKQGTTTIYTTSGTGTSMSVNWNSTFLWRV